MTRERAPQATHWRYKDDRKGQGNFRVVQKSPKYLLRVVQNVQLTGTVPKISRIDNLVIGFSKEDARRLHHPHDNAFVVNLRVGDYNMHRVLVDNSNSTEILYYLAF